MEIGFHFPVVVKKGGQIDEEVSNHREKGKGFNQGRFFQQVFDMGSAGQDIFSIDSHPARATHSPATGVAKSERPILLLLNTEQCFQKIHSLSGLHLKGLDPLGRVLLLVQTFDSQGQKIGFHRFNVKAQVAKFLSAAGSQMSNQIQSSKIKNG